MSNSVVALFFTLGISAWVYAKFLTRPGMDTKEKLIVLSITVVFLFVLWLIILNFIASLLN